MSSDSVFLRLGRRALTRGVLLLGVTLCVPVQAQTSQRPAPTNPRPATSPQRPATQPQRPSPYPERQTFPQMAPQTAKPATAPSASASSTPGSRLDYRLGVADLIRIRVHGEDDLALDTRLDEKGTITYPFLGEVRAVGLTVRELERQLVTGLKAGYLTAPEVQVIVIEYRPFYVNGEVKRPGGYPYTPGLTVQKALSLAGGFTPLASQNKIFVIREKNSGGRREAIRMDGVILPGDTLIVEEGLF